MKEMLNVIFLNEQLLNRSLNQRLADLIVDFNPGNDFWLSEPSLDSARKCKYNTFRNLFVGTEPRFVVESQALPVIVVPEDPVLHLVYGSFAGGLRSRDLSPFDNLFAP